MKTIHVQRICSICSGKQRSQYMKPIAIYAISLECRKINSLKEIWLCNCVPNKKRYSLDIKNKVVFDTTE